MLCVVLLNEVPADHSDLAAQLTPDWLARAAAGLQKQLREHVAPAWPYAQDAVVRVGANATDFGDAETPCHIVATLDDPEAEAFHADEDDGQPDEYMGIDTVATTDDITGAIGHENDEVCGDPECDQWVTVPDGIDLPSGLLTSGMQIAREICDPLQDRTYPIDLGDGGPPIIVPDFVLPPYFSVALSGPTSYGEAACGYARLAPFGRTSGGYQLARNGDGSGETQVFGYMPPHRRMKAKHRSSRTYRRGLRIGPSTPPRSSAPPRS